MRVGENLKKAVVKIGKNERREEEKSEAVLFAILKIGREALKRYTFRPFSLQHTSRPHHRKRNEMQ